MSLKEQLKRIGTADLRNVTEASRKHKASFLFSSREAADQDLETIYALAHNGIIELGLLDERLSAFEKTLFSEKMKGVDRVLQTPSENAQLDESIALFLQHLSPYFLLKPAGKAIEWLLRRFRIHQFNVEAILACILPYHETKAFVKMVSLLEIEPESPWKFLLPVKESNIPLDRSLLVKAMKKNRRVFDFVCKTVIQSPVHFPALYAFFAATLIEFVKDRKNVEDSTMTALIPFMVESLKSRKTPELQIAAYMIISQLASTTENLSDLAISTLAETMTKYYNEQYYGYCMLTIIHLAQAQNSFEMNEKSIKRLLKAPMFEKELLRHAEKYATDRFMAAILPALCNSIPKHPEKAELLKEMVHRGLLSSDNISMLSNCAIDGYMGLVNDSANESKRKAYIEAFQPLMTLLSQCYVDEVDAVLQARLKAAESGSSELLYDFTSAVFNGTMHQVVREANTTLFLCLNSPSVSTRLLAVQKLVSVMDDGNSPLAQSPDVIESALAESLSRFNELLHYAVTQGADYVLRYVPKETIVSQMTRLLRERKAFKKFEIVPVMKFLVSKFVQRFPEEQEFVARQLSLFVFAGQLKAVKAFTDELESIKFAGNLNLLERTFKNAKSAVSKALEEEEHQGKSENKGKSGTSMHFIKLEAAAAAGGSSDSTVWVSMANSSFDLEKILGLLVLIRAVLIAENVDHSVLAVLVLDEVLPSMTPEQRRMFYRNPLPDSFLDWKEGVVSDMALYNFRKGYNIPEESKVSLMQSLVKCIVLSLRPVTTTAGVPWLSGSSGDSTTTVYREIIMKLFKTLVSGPVLGSFEPILAGLISNHLKDDILSFLLSFWSSDEYKPAVRARSLQIATSYVRHFSLPNVPPVDLQHIVPGLLPALTDQEKSVRCAALDCLKQLSALYESQGLPNGPKLFGFDPLEEAAVNGHAATTTNSSKLDIMGAHVIYGVSDLQQQITNVRSNEVARFVCFIVHRRREISEDPSYMSRLLTNYVQLCNACQFKQFRARMNQVFDLLLDHARLTPMMDVKIGILTLLDNVHIPRKLQALVPALESCLATATTSQDKKKTSRLIELLTHCYLPSNASELGSSKNEKALPLFEQLLSNQVLLEGEGEGGLQLSTRRLALKQINHEFYANVNQDVKRSLFRHLIDIATNGEQNDVRASKQVLAAVDIPAALFDEFLTAFAKSVTTLSEILEPTAPTSKRRTITKREEVPSVEFYELVTVLELIESKTISNDATLMKPLFDVLASMVNATLRDTPVSLEYIYQLIMSALTRIIRTAQESETTIDGSWMRVDIVVQCIRTTGNPQTHNQALLLMATIASLYPESVLHNVMAIFTFMGANVLRQDDNYSFQVIQQTLEKVIPPLVASSRGANVNANETQMALQVKPIIKVFVSALFHIPKHRRLPLFTVLVRTLGEDEFLFAVISLLLEKYADKFVKSGGDKDGSADDSLAEFCLAISQQFAPQTQMKAVLLLLNGLLVLPNDVSTEDVEMKTEEEGKEDNETALFNVHEHNGKELRRYKLVVLQYIDQLVASKGFLAKVMEHMEADEQFEQVSLQPLYLNAIEVLLKIVTYFTEFRNQYAVSEDAKAGVTRFWRGILKVCYDVLDRINSLLPLAAFVDVVSHLVKHPETIIRRKALDLFNERIGGIDTETTDVVEENEEALVGMVKKFVGVIINESSTGSSNEENAVNKQAALLCISSLARLLGNKSPAAFADAIPTVIGEHALQMPNIQVKISSLACLAVICEEIGPRAVPHLPKFMPAVIDLLLTTVNDTEKPSSMLQLGVISALTSIISVLSHFVSPYLSKLLSGLLHSSLFEYDDDTEDSNERAMVETKTNELLLVMAEKVQPRVLLPPVFAFYDTALRNGKKVMLAMLSLVSNTIRCMSRDAMTAHYKALFKFFLIAFDLRCLHDTEFDEESVNEIEESIISVFLSLVMKLNETLFKPLYLKIVDWATVELSSSDAEDKKKKRVLFFYKLTDALLERLKSIFTPYYGYVVDDVITRLQRVISGEEQVDVLWNYVMSSLRKSFLYDSDNLWSAAKFEKILDPVIDQMMVTAPDEDGDKYLNRMITYVASCVGQMAVTVSNDTLWKPLNQKVLLKTREDVPEIRLAALKCLEELYTRLGEEWLLFLAESISYLAELMEDDDPRVEKLVQQVNALIEVHLGESLDKFFN